MKINLFFFISSFSYGGAGNAVFNYLKNLNKKKYDLHIIFLGKSDYENLLPKHVKSYKLHSNFILFKTFLIFFKIKKILIKKSFSNKKNIFISNIHYSNVLSILFLRKIKNLRIILFERTSIKELDIYINFFSFIKNKIIKSLIKYTYSQADRVLVNSNVLKSELKKFSITSTVAYSGSINKIKQKSFNIKKNLFNIIAVGRLTPQKDYFTLLDAIRNLKNRNFILKIYGDGELKNRLKDYIDRYNLKKIVKLIGHQSNINKIYSKADLLVHSAIFEGLPNAIVEAMSHGTPIIASNSFGGTREVLNSGKFGDLFKPKDSVKLRMLIENFFKNPKILYKKVSKSKSFLNRFKQKKSSRCLEKILMSI